MSYMWNGVIEKESLYQPVKITTSQKMAEEALMSLSKSLHLNEVLLQFPVRLSIV